MSLLDELLLWGVNAVSSKDDKIAAAAGAEKKIITVSDAVLELSDNEQNILFSKIAEFPLAKQYVFVGSIIKAEKKLDQHLNNASHTTLTVILKRLLTPSDDASVIPEQFNLVKSLINRNYSILSTDIIDANFFRNLVDKGHKELATTLIYYLINKKNKPSKSRKTYINSLKSDPELKNILDWLLTIKRDQKNIFCNLANHYHLIQTNNKTLAQLKLYCKNLFTRLKELKMSIEASQELQNIVSSHVRNGVFFPPRSPQPLSPTTTKALSPVIDEEVISTGTVQPFNSNKPFTEVSISSDKTNIEQSRSGANQATFFQPPPINFLLTTFFSTVVTIENGLTQLKLGQIKTVDEINYYVNHITTTKQVFDGVIVALSSYSNYINLANTISLGLPYIIENNVFESLCCRLYWQSTTHETILLSPENISTLFHYAINRNRYCDMALMQFRDVLLQMQLPLQSSGLKI